MSDRKLKDDIITNTLVIAATELAIIQGGLMLMRMILGLIYPLLTPQNEQTVNSPRNICRMISAAFTTSIPGICSKTTRTKPICRS